MWLLVNISVEYHIRIARQTERISPNWTLKTLKKCKWNVMIQHMNCNTPHNDWQCIYPTRFQSSRISFLKGVWKRQSCIFYVTVIFKTFHKKKKKKILRLRNALEKLQENTVNRCADCYNSYAVSLTFHLHFYLYSIMYVF